MCVRACVRACVRTCVRVSNELIPGTDTKIIADWEQTRATHSE